MPRNCARLLPILCLGLILIPLQIQAATRDVSAHFEDETYWQAHAIYLARITAIKIDTNGGYDISFTPIELISGSSFGTIRTIQLSGNLDRFQIGGQPDNFPQKNHPGDEILLNEDIREHNITVAKVIESATTDSLLKALHKLVAIRAHPSPAILFSSAVSADDPVLVNWAFAPSDGHPAPGTSGNDYLVQTYCLKRLLAQTNLGITPDNVASLQQIQSNQTLGLETRFLVCQIVLKFSHDPTDVGTEYSCLESLVAANTHGDSADYLQLVDTLVAIPDRRDQTVKFLCDLAENPKFPRHGNAVSNALNSILGGLCSPALFHYDDPDSQSDGIFTMGVTLLNHCPPEERDSVAFMIHALCAGMWRVDPARHRSYMDRTVAALKLACKKDPDDLAIKSYLVDIEQSYPVFFPSRDQQRP